MTSLPRLRFPHRFLSCFAALLLITGGAQAQGSYTYTSVIDSSGPLKEFDAFFPSINNKSAVVFHAKFPAAGGQPSGEGIYVTEGSSYRGIAVTGGVYTGFRANPTINDNGFVAFEASGRDNSEGIFVGDGKTVGNKTIATSTSGRLLQFSLVIRASDYGVALDEQGNAVFSANLQTSRQRALFAGDGSKPETQLDNPVPGITPAVNASGAVAFLSGTGEIKRTTVAGGSAITIATPAGDSPFESFDAVSINDAGTVAFTAKLKAGGYGVYTGDGNGDPKLVLNTTTQPSFSRFRSVSINNTGSVAFGADFASGGSNIVVFGPTGGRVVLTSNLFGSTLAGFFSTITPRALNDLGQVVFWYRLANGKQGFAVATPSNGVEPRTLGNISTRLPVLTGENALIGGFIVLGDQPKNVIIRAIGPSLGQAGVNGALADPVLELIASDGTVIASNDNWKDAQQQEIQQTGVAPSNDLESAIMRFSAAGQLHRGPARQEREHWRWACRGLRPESDLRLEAREHQHARLRGHRRKCPHRRLHCRAVYQNGGASDWAITARCRRKQRARRPAA